MSEAGASDRKVPAGTATDLPGVAAWRHLDARDGFEVVFIHEQPEGGVRFEGTTTAVEAGAAWMVRYVIEVDAQWTTRSASIERRDEAGTASLELVRATEGWTANGDPAPELDGCLDVDLESSALTNAFPLRRHPLATGAHMDAPAAYVRVGDLSVGVLEQRYERLNDAAGHAHYAYAAPAFDFTAELAYDASGLVASYPGLAMRAA